MIPISVGQRDVVLKFFKVDVEVVKKHFAAVAFDFEDDFEYMIFKEFLFSAAGMFKELDVGIYNKALAGKFQTINLLDKHYREFKHKSEYAQSVYERTFLTSQIEYSDKQKSCDAIKQEMKLLGTRETTLKAKLDKVTRALEKKKKSLSKEQLLAYQEKIKPLRREHVDTVHLLGSLKNELVDIQKELNLFEKEHKQAFLDFFVATRDKIEHQYISSLNYFGFVFNENLFVNSEKSAEIQKFKQQANIRGSIDICRYLEYYLKNVNPDSLHDPSRQKQLLKAKSYCKRLREKELLW
jgi:hypothetical protein